jgi:hypothetical protein
MESEQGERAPKQKKGFGGVLVKAAIIVVAVAGIASAGYFQDNLKGIFALQAWDRNAPKKVVADFIAAARSENPDPVGEMLLPAAFEVERDDEGKVSVVKYVDFNGLRTVPPKDLVPESAPTQMEAVIRSFGDTYYYSVVVGFEDGKWGVFRVDRVDGKLQIAAVPAVYDDTRPADLTVY